METIGTIALIVVILITIFEVVSMYKQINKLPDETENINRIAQSFGLTDNNNKPTKKPKTTK